MRLKTCNCVQAVLASRPPLPLTWRLIEHARFRPSGPSKYRVQAARAGRGFSHAHVSRDVDLAHTEESPFGGFGSGVEVNTKGAPSLVRRPGRMWAIRVAAARERG